ncbi:MAG: hypothetical protein OXJ55_21865, partial [Caldilineaceae bacterium]|nr:hypothetical protein [Caldilineaceae bacterium]
GGAPPPQTPPYCLPDLVSTLVTGAQSKMSSQTTSRQSHQIPVGACPVPLEKPDHNIACHRRAFPA